MNKPLIDLTVLEVEPAGEYHAKADTFLSSHQLIDFMRCPYLYAKKRAGLIERTETPAFLVGRAAHCRILEGQNVYASEFALGGPINPKTGKAYGSNTKKFAEWRAEQGKPVLSWEQDELIENMAAGVSMNDVACELLQHGRAEGVVRAEYCGVECQIRIDWTNPHMGIVDLKTTADLDWFENDSRRHGYHHQLAFYQAVLEKAITADRGSVVPRCREVTVRRDSRLPVYLIGVEKVEPFRCGVWRIPDDTLAIARGENEAAIARLKVARESNRWTTGYESIRLLDVA